MREIFTAIAAAVAGATAMYYLDPDTGYRRRARVRDKAVSLTTDAGDFARTQGQRASERMKDLAASARSKLHMDATDNADGTASPHESEEWTNASEHTRSRLAKLLPFVAVAAPIALIVAASAQPVSRSRWSTWRGTNPLARFAPTAHHSGPMLRARR